MLACCYMYTWLLSDICGTVTTVEACVAYLLKSVTENLTAASCDSQPVIF